MYYFRRLDLVMVKCHETLLRIGMVMIVGSDFSSTPRNPVGLELVMEGTLANLAGIYCCSLD